jgi:hypothetical protein
MAAEPVRIPVPVETPVAVFDIVTRGYERDQVHEYVARLEQELAELRWEKEFVDAREVDLAARQEELDRRQALIDTWEPSWQTLGEHAQQIMATTQQHASTLRAQAARESKESRARAEIECATLREAAEQEADTLRRSAHRLLDVARSDAERLRELLDLDLDRKRRDGELEITGLVNRARVTAEEAIAAALRQANRITDDARVGLARLQRERDEITRQLEKLVARLQGSVIELNRPDEEEDD